MNPLKYAVCENVATLAACVALVLGSRWLGAGGWSWLGLFVLGNLNRINFHVVNKQGPAG